MINGKIKLYFIPQAAAAVSSIALDLDLFHAIALDFFLFNNKIHVFFPLKLEAPLNNT